MKNPTVVFLCRDTHGLESCFSKSLGNDKHFLFFSTAEKIKKFFLFFSVIVLFFSITKVFVFVCMNLKVKKKFTY